MFMVSIQHFYFFCSLEDWTLSLQPSNRAEQYLTVCPICTPNVHFSTSALQSLHLFEDWVTCQNMPVIMSQPLQFHSTTAFTQIVFNSVSFPHQPDPSLNKMPEKGLWNANLYLTWFLASCKVFPVYIWVVKIHSLLPLLLFTLLLTKSSSCYKVVASVIAPFIAHSWQTSSWHSSCFFFFFLFFHARTVSTFLPLPVGYYLFFLVIICL